MARKHFKLVPYFAKPIIKKHNLNKCERDELIQEGYIGLIHACRKYNPELNFKFSTYSSYWIRSYINRYIKKKHKSLKTLPLNTEGFIEKSDVNIQFYENVLFDLDLALESLETWEYEFIRKRFFDRMTIKDMAIESGLSRNTISKKSAEIINKLKYRMIHYTEY
jgi:RNA polymerase sigma factor (sigma-70 family)